MSNLQRDVYWKIRNTSNFLRSELSQRIEENGISWQQFHALYHIQENGIPSNELAKELSCNASNMTGLVDRMIENGWVYREHSTIDRRVWLVKLTDEGVHLKNKLLPIHRNNIVECMNVLSKEELTTLDQLLTKLMKQKATSGEATYEGD